MSDKPPFPWADKPLATRVLLTGLTLPIAAPVMMVLALLLLGVSAILVLAIPFAYVLAGIAPASGDGHGN